MFREGGNFGGKGKLLIESFYFLSDLNCEEFCNECCKNFKIFGIDGSGAGEGWSEGFIEYFKINFALQKNSDAGKFRKKFKAQKNCRA